jgi:hypothetical protein
MNGLGSDSLKIPHDAPDCVKLEPKVRSYREDENPEALKIGGGEDRVGDDTRRNHIPAKKNPRLR